MSGGAFPQRYSGVITAGHCLGIGGGPFQERWRQGRHALGVYAQKEFRTGAKADAGAISTSRVFTKVRDVSNKVFVAPGAGTINITSVQSRDDDRVGDVVCMSGAFSGYQCGVLTKLHFSRRYRSGPVIVDLRAAHFDQPCQLGDSGAPMFRGDGLALGILSARGVDTRTCIYSHIDNVQRQLRISITTR